MAAASFWDISPCEVEIIINEEGVIPQGIDDDFSYNLLPGLENSLTSFTTGSLLTYFSLRRRVLWSSSTASYASIKLFFYNNLEIDSQNFEYGAVMLFLPAL